MSSRSVFSERIDASFVPFPFIERLTTSTVPARLTSVLTGSCRRPVASALPTIALIEFWIWGVRTLSALIRTVAGMRSPGNAFCTLL